MLLIIMNLNFLNVLLFFTLKELREAKANMLGLEDVTPTKMKIKAVRFIETPHYAFL